MIYMYIIIPIYDKIRFRLLHVMHKYREFKIMVSDSIIICIYRSLKASKPDRVVSVWCADALLILNYQYHVR